MADRPLQALVSPARPVQQCRDISCTLGCAIEELGDAIPTFTAHETLKRARATLRMLRAAIAMLYRPITSCTRRGAADGEDPRRRGHATVRLAERFGTTISAVNCRPPRTSFRPRSQGHQAALNRAMTLAGWHPTQRAGFLARTHSTYRRADAHYAARAMIAQRDCRVAKKTSTVASLQFHADRTGPAASCCDSIISLLPRREHDLAVLRPRGCCVGNRFVDAPREFRQCVRFGTAGRGQVERSYTSRKLWTQWHGRNGANLTESPLHRLAIRGNTLPRVVNDSGVK